MKNIKNFFVSIFLVIGMPLSSVLAQNSLASTGSAVNVDLVSLTDNTINPDPTAAYWKEIFMEDDVYNNVPPPMNFTVTVPAVWHSQIERVDYENESILSLKTGDQAPAFLFSVTKVTDAQWMQLKDQVKGYTIIENKDGFITFVQKANTKKMKEPADAHYLEVLGLVDAMVASIRVN